jgi:hypothetical protein
LLKSRTVENDDTLPQRIDRLLDLLERIRGPPELSVGTT